MARVGLLDVEPGYCLKMLEVKCVEAGGPRKGLRGDERIRNAKARGQPVSKQQRIGCGELRSRVPEYVERREESLNPFQFIPITATHHKFQGNYTWNCERFLGNPVQPRFSGQRSAQTVHQDIGIDEIHPLCRAQLSDRTFRANSKLSVISARLHHIPKNSLLSKSPKVVPMDDEDDMVMTIDTVPVGTSSGSVILSSRLAGISALKLILFVMPASPYQTIPEQLGNHNGHCSNCASRRKP